MKAAIRLVEVMGVDRQDQEQRKRFIRFTDADVQSLKVLGPFIESHGFGPSSGSDTSWP